MKPVIRKSPQGWRIYRIGYGFTHAVSVSNPFPSWGDAVKAATTRMAAGSYTVNSVNVPYSPRYLGYSRYPVVR